MAQVPRQTRQGTALGHIQSGEPRALIEERFQPRPGVRQGLQGLEVEGEQAAPLLHHRAGQLVLGAEVVEYGAGRHGRPRRHLGDRRARIADLVEAGEGRGHEPFALPGRSSSHSRSK